MAFLVLDDARWQLRLGPNTLGGRGADAVGLAPLAALPPVAVITVQRGAAAVIRRVSHEVPVRVEGRTLGAKRRKLRHGDRVVVGGCRLVYDAATAAAAPPAEAAAVASWDPSEQGTQILSVASEAASARLVEVSTGRAVPVPGRGLVIGRSKTSGLVIDDSNVSRRHAVVVASGAGYVVTDESANGTLVNGVRVVGACRLSHGDVVRIAATEFRFECEVEGGASAGPSHGATKVVAAPTRATGAARGVVARGEEAPGEGERPVLATLEVTGGPLAGTVFPIHRAVCAIGRADGNDVRVAHESVSGSHATLLLKDGAWYVTDLRSVNGTFVDGYRVAVERALPADSVLKVGQVKLRFRPRRRVAGARQTQVANGVLGRLVKKLL